MLSTSLGLVSNDRVRSSRRLFKKLLRRQIRVGMSGLLYKLKSSAEKSLCRHSAYALVVA